MYFVGAFVVSNCLHEVKELWFSICLRLHTSNSIAIFRITFQSEAIEISQGSLKFRVGFSSYLEDDITLLGFVFCKGFILFGCCLVLCSVGYGDDIVLFGSSPIYRSVSQFISLGVSQVSANLAHLEVTMPPRPRMASQ